MPEFLEGDVLKDVYGYSFKLNKVESVNEISDFNGTSIFIANQTKLSSIILSKTLTFMSAVLQNLEVFYSLTANRTHLMFQKYNMFEDEKQLQ